MDKFISIREASLMIGVTTTTLRRWEENGLFSPNHRTLGNHRRYLLKEVLNLINPRINNENVIKKTICYARDSSFDQKEDLKRQVSVLEKYTKDKYTNIEVINDIGSGLNFKKKGLNKLLKLILDNQIDRIILTHKDRLLRFGSDLIINIAKYFNIETYYIK